MSSYPNVTDTNPENIGPRGFYYILEKLKRYLLGNPNEGQVQGNVDMFSINTVTYGDITEVDLNKTSIFPLAHIMVDNVALSSIIYTFNLTIIFADLVIDKFIPEDYIESGTNPEVSQPAPVRDFTFEKTSNEQDVLNTMLVVANKLNTALNRGGLSDDYFELVQDGTCEPFKDRFENEIAGWVYSVSIKVKNDIDKCENV